MQTITLNDADLNILIHSIDDNVRLLMAMRGLGRDVLWNDRNSAVRKAVNDYYDEYTIADDDYEGGYFDEYPPCFDTYPPFEL